VRLAQGVVLASSALFVALLAAADPLKSPPGKTPASSATADPSPASSASGKRSKSSPPHERVPLWAEAPKLTGEREPRVIVDRVAAVVGRDIITLTAVRRRAAPVVRALFNLPVAQQIEMTRKAELEALDQLIDDNLIMRIAAKKSLKVDDSEVDAAMEKVMTQTGLSRDALLKAVADTHENEEEYRAELKIEMLRYKFVQAVIVPRTIGRPGISGPEWEKLLLAELKVWSAEQRVEVFVEVRL
jgi:hypothetical protein